MQKQMGVSGYSPPLGRPQQHIHARGSAWNSDGNLENKTGHLEEGQWNLWDLQAPGPVLEAGRRINLDQHFKHSPPASVSESAFVTSLAA